MCNTTMLYWHYIMTMANKHWYSAVYVQFFGMVIEPEFIWPSITRNIKFNLNLVMLQGPGEANTPRVGMVLVPLTLEH